MSATSFKEDALPLHVHFTHTPPSATSPKKGSTEPNKQMDAGHIASVALMPAIFSTGSYGWKASKPIAIEVTDPNTGKKTKMMVQIGINAVVKDSKETPADDAAPDAGKSDAEESEEADVENAISGAVDEEEVESEDD